MRKILFIGALVLLFAALLYPARASQSNVSRETTATSTAPVAAPAPVIAPKRTPSPEPTEIPLATSTPLTASQSAIKAEVQAAFPDVPGMVAIVACESHFRQLSGNGTPLISRTDDVGVAQINIPSWGAEAARLHLDIYNSVADNLAMARVVYERQGLQAWTCKP